MKKCTGILIWGILPRGSGRVHNVPYGTLEFFNKIGTSAYPLVIDSLEIHDPGWHAACIRFKQVGEHISNDGKVVFAGCGLYFNIDLPAIIQSTIDWELPLS
jgi:hypothetical protein